MLVCNEYVFIVWCVGVVRCCRLQVHHHQRSQDHTQIGSADADLTAEEQSRKRTGRVTTQGQRRILLTEREREHSVPSSAMHKQLWSTGINISAKFAFNRVWLSRKTFGNPSFTWSKVSVKTSMCWIKNTNDNTNILSFSSVLLYFYTVYSCTVEMLCIMSLCFGLEMRFNLQWLNEIRSLLRVGSPGEQTALERDRKWPLSFIKLLPVYINRAKITRVLRLVSTL